MCSCRSLTDLAWTRSISAGDVSPDEGKCFFVFVFCGGPAIFTELVLKGVCDVFNGLWFICCNLRKAFDSMAISRQNRYLHL